MLSDLHGEEETARKYSKVAKAGDLVIVVGDFGVSWYADKTVKYADIAFFKSTDYSIGFNRIIAMD